MWVLNGDTGGPARLQREHPTNGRESPAVARSTDEQRMSDIFKIYSMTCTSFCPLKLCGALSITKNDRQILEETRNFNEEDQLKAWGIANSGVPL